MYIDLKGTYQGQRNTQAPLPADPGEAAELRQPRAVNWRLERELEI